MPTAGRSCGPVGRWPLLTPPFPCSPLPIAQTADYARGEGVPTDKGLGVAFPYCVRASKGKAFVQGTRGDFGEARSVLVQLPAVRAKTAHAGHGDKLLPLAYSLQGYG